MTSSEPRSEVFFSQVREDPLIELRVLEDLGRPEARVLLIASGGDTALSLLTRPVGEVHALDPNPAQLHLVRFKAAASRLPPEDRDVVLGLAEGDRLGLYRALELPEEARAFWDARLEEVAFGVNRVGRFEALFRRLAEALRTQGWDAAFAEVFDRDALRAVFGPAAVDYSMDRGFDEHFKVALWVAMATWQRADNYFLDQVMLDRYGLACAGRPPWMLEPLDLSRLRLHLGRFDEVLERLEGDFDLVHTSNISDWMPVPELSAMIERVAERLTPGGALVARRLNGDHDLAAVVGRHLRVDEARSAREHLHDRSFFYSEVVVAYR